MSHVRIPARDLRPGDAVENLFGDRFRVAAVAGPLEGRDTLDVALEPAENTLRPAGRVTVEMPPERPVCVFERANVGDAKRRGP